MFLRDALSVKRKTVFKEEISHADHCLAVSKALAKKLEDIELDLSVEVVGNMVDTEYFQPQSVSHSGVFVFMIVASLNENKRVGDAIRAFANSFSAVDNSCV